MQNSILSQLQVNKDIPVPLYYQLEQSLLRLIKKNVLSEGDLIPSEIDISTRLNISRPTVRQALNSMVESGYLVRNRGIGTFVTKPKITDQFFIKLESYNDEMLRQDLVPKTKVLSFKKIRGIERINEKLNLDYSKSLIHLERLRYADDTPIVYLDTYLPYDEFSELLSFNLEQHSLYDLMKTKAGYDVEHAQRYIESVLAKEHEAKLLEIDVNDPICLTKSTSYVKDNKPVEYSVARYRGDKTKFLVEIYK